MNKKYDRNHKILTYNLFPSIECFKNDLKNFKLKFCVVRILIWLNRPPFKIKCTYVV